MRVRLLSEAEADIAQIADWYHRRSADLAIRLLEAVDARITELKEYPRAHPVIENNIRRVLLSDFPYHVYYAVEADELVILGLYHAARDPNLWRERL